MPAHRHPRESKYHLPKLGPYRSSYCHTKSSLPVAPWSNPRRSPYCPRRHSDDDLAYHVNIGTPDQQDEAERIAEEPYEAAEQSLEDAIPRRFRQTGQFGKFWINPAVKTKNIRDPNYYRFPEGLPRCGFRNCPHTYDLKRDEDVEALLKGYGHYEFNVRKKDSARKRRNDRRKALQWHVPREIDTIGVLSYEEEGYVGVESKGTS